jgi:hypothetical protein
MIYVHPSPDVNLGENVLAFLDDAALPEQFT